MGRVNDALAKYTRRAVGEGGRPGLGCEDPTAEWHEDLGVYHKCILIVVLERLQLPPQAKVLDWGTGCGHKLSWASRLFDIDGMGLDIVNESVFWAQEHSIGHFCRVDGRFVEW